MEMNAPLDGQQVVNARRAILNRFVKLDRAPNTIANINLFRGEQDAYRGGYFEAAIEQLIRDKCIEFAKAGLFLQLMPKGYDEAHKLA